MIDLNKLHHFVVLVQHGSYRSAAAELKLSQPGLSRSIQSLERQHGVVLLDRGRAGVTLTAVGRQFLQRAEDLIANSRSLEHGLEAAARGIEGEVRLGMGPSAGSLVLPETIATLTRDHPRISMTVVLGGAAELIDRLLNGEIEFCICRVEPSLVRDRVQVERLCRAETSFVVRHGHPLLQLPQVPLKDLEGYPKLSGSAWNARVWQEHTSEHARAQLHSSVEVDDFDLLSRVSRESDAVLVSPYGMASEGLARLVLARQVQRMFGFDVGACTLRRRTPSPAATVALSLLRAGIRTKLGPLAAA